MEANKAKINGTEDRSSLVLYVNEQEFEIILTDDNPNNIKGVFNNLLKELKKGIFEFELDDDGDDLYYHICSEYLVQLNLELKSVYQELQDHDLLEINDGD